MDVFPPFASLLQFAKESKVKCLEVGTRAQKKESLLKWKELERCGCGLSVADFIGITGKLETY
jgi:hypothetical protein